MLVVLRLGVGQEHTEKHMDELYGDKLQGKTTPHGENALRDKGTHCEGDGSGESDSGKDRLVETDTRIEDTGIP